MILDRFAILCVFATWRAQMSFFVDSRKGRQDAKTRKELLLQHEVILLATEKTRTPSMSRWIGITVTRVTQRERQRSYRVPIHSQPDAES
jgi:hypothetical protein